ncbi:MAG: proline--tRNA ligase [Firmicutes bacterium]|nr:proline--tRNA ligase [Bacillota bacterium]
MRMSRLFGRTLREAPAEAQIESHKLLLRAGMIRPLAAGIYTYMPLAWRTYKKIADIMREEMDAIGGQEINMPVVHPAEVWQETGRWYDIGPEMVRFKDRSGRDMVLAMTHEEVITDLLRREVDSHRQLPFMAYHMQTKFRDEPRARGGLIRVREFVMKDAYSFHKDQACLDEYYPKMCQAYFNICHRCGVDVVMVLSDVGMMGGSMAHEFMLVTPVGEDTLVLCEKCGYAANMEVAVARKDAPAGAGGAAGVAGAAGSASGPADVELPLEEVATPGQKDIESVARFLGVSPSQTLKTMVYVAKGETVLAVIRGDLQIQERKLGNALKVGEIRLATEEEARAAGLVPGYTSPIGLKAAGKAFRVVADDSVPAAKNLVAGANKEGYHVRNANIGRDFSAEIVTDIAAAVDGSICSKCGGVMHITRGIEVGNTFKLGLKYSKSMGATYLDVDGQEKPIVEASYGIGLGRMLSCVVEQNHDDSGIIWPATVAPFHIHLLTLGESEDVRGTGEKLYAGLLEKKFEVLYDDRDASAGVKFNDADLLGMPVRITVSQRSLSRGGVEMKLRREKESTLVPLDEVFDRARAVVEAEKARFVAKHLEGLAARL